MKSDRKPQWALATRTIQFTAFFTSRSLPRPRRSTSSAQMRRAKLFPRPSSLLKKADDVAVLSVCGHPVPGSCGEDRRVCLDDGMEPLGHGAIRFRHLGNLRHQVSFSIRFLRAQLSGAILHCQPFLVRESPVCLGDSCAGLRYFFLRSHKPIRVSTLRLHDRPDFE